MGSPSSSPHEDDEVPGSYLVLVVLHLHLEHQQGIILLSLPAHAVAELRDDDVFDRYFHCEARVGVLILVVIDCGGDVEDEFPGLGEVL